ncbi:hypothetical protein JG688_00010638 [Phytophthora aleatoria]|uniref:Uncharacterized protein n=1 Tax=Phytophthora aleatoria TaxID=2496075 RepID=A0A8J5MF09_9STRA|nr:hypothetical protein JG688_00010638 [Phytophthora aleatoria]
MEDEEAVVVATCAAVAHAAVWLAATCEPPPREPKKQIRTVAVLHFEPMFQSAAYTAWFEDNLRCTKSTLLMTYKDMISDWQQQRSRITLTTRSCGCALFLFFGLYR